MKIRLQYLPWYYPNASYIDPLHLNTILMGVGKVQNIYAHVDIIKVNLMKFIEKCQK